MKYTHLLFDVDNTLLDFDRAEHDALTDSLMAFGFPTDESIVAAYSRINDAHWKMLERGEMDRKTVLWHRFAELGEAFNLSTMDPHAFCATYIHHLSQKAYLMDGALEVCAKLAERYEMAVITNGNAAVQRGRFEPSPLRRYFSHCFVSELIGANKPAPAFFEAVCRELPELRPEQTLVIGDSLTSDIAGGVLWGTDTCWLCPDEKKRVQAAERGLQPTYIISHLQELLRIL